MGCTRELEIGYYDIKQIMRLGLHLSSLIQRPLLIYRTAIVASVSLLFPQIDMMGDEWEVVAPVKVLLRFLLMQGRVPTMKNVSLQ